jgi:hypothetical protein
MLALERLNDGDQFNDCYISRKIIMIGNILTYKEYQEVVEHCRTCKSAFAIKYFVDDVFNEYRRFNTDLETSLMEYIESNYKTLNGDFELAYYDILNLREDIPQYEDPSLEYLYSYLVLLSDKEKPGKKIDTAKAMPFSLKENITPRQISKVLASIKDKGFCTFSSPARVNWIFSGNEKGANGEKIQWIDKAVKNKGGNYHTLLAFLEAFCMTNHLNTSANMLWILVSKRFVNIEGKEFTFAAFKQVITRYKEAASKGKMSPRVNLIMNNIIE